MTVDYQVTPVLLEEITMEYLALRPRPHFLRRFGLPILLATVCACQAIGTKPEFVIGDRAYPEVALAINMILSAAGGFGVGLAVTLLARRVLRRRVVAAQARKGQAWDPGTRTFSWDETGISVASPIWRHEWKWIAVDDIREGRIGLYFIWKGHLLCSVPKHVLPAEGQAENLRVMLRRKTPPPLPNREPD